jgi:hypothetical protein
MIPMVNIIAWSGPVPWADIRQDLIISRALVDLFGEAMLARNCAFAAVQVQ